MLRVTPITTERLVLKPLEIGDSKFVFALVNTEQWLRNIGERNVHTENAAVIYIEKILANANVKYWVIKTKEAISVGIITLLKRDYLEHWDLGFALLPEFIGYGYAYEGSKAVLEYLSRIGDFRKIMAITLPTNTPSIRLLSSLGFVYQYDIVRENEKLSLYCVDI